MAAGLPTSVVVECEFTAGVWTAVTTFVQGEVHITQGSETLNGVQPGTLEMTLDNGSDNTGAGAGRFTPDNALSPYFPNVTEGTRVRVTATKGAATSVRFIGETTAWLPDYPDGDPYSGTVTVQAVDLVGDLERVTLRSSMDSEAILLEPVAYWPMTGDNPEVDDNEDVIGGIDFRPTSYTPEAGSGFTGGIEAGATLGAERRPSTRFTGYSEWRLDAGPLEADVPAFGYSLSMWVRVEDKTGGSSTFVTIATGDGAGTKYATITSDASDVFTVVYNGELIISGGTMVRRRWHHVCLTHSTIDTARLYIDGTQVASQTLMAPSYSGVKWGLLQLAYDPFGLTGFIGSVGSVALYDYQLSTAQVGDLYRSGTYKASRTAAAQLARISALTGVTVSLDSATTRNVVQPVTEGRSGLDVVEVMANTLGFTVQHRPDTSAVTIISPETMRPTTVALTLDGEADVDGSPAFAREIAERFAAVTVKTSVRDTTVVDQTLVGSFGYPSTEVEAAFHSRTDARALGSDVLARGTGKKLRIPAVSVDLVTATNDLYAAWFATHLGERVRVSNIAGTPVGFTYSDGLLVGYEEYLSPDSYRIDLKLASADAPPEAVTDSGDYGRVTWGDGLATNTSSATSSATSVAFQWTGGAPLSTAAGDYPLDLDWNGERVRVTSAPAGSSSPQTLTITRGIAPSVARAHAAGEPVDIWTGARVAY